MDGSILTSKVIQHLLENNEYVMAYLSNEDKKIFPLQQPDDITFPFIVYQRNSIIPTYNKDYMGWYNTVTFEVACVSNDYVQSLELANAVRHALEWHYWKNEQINIQRIDVTTINEYAIDTDSETVFIQSISLNMVVLPTKGPYIDPNAPVSPTGVSPTGISPTGISPTGATGV